MNSFILHAALALMITTIPLGLARAEGGELTLRITTGQGVARLHPVGRTLRPTVLYLPRLGGQVVYGLTHWLQTGIEFQASFPREYSVSTTTAYRGVIGANVTGAYHDFILAVPLEFRRSRGLPLTLWAELAPAVQVALLSDRAIEISSPPRRVDLPPFSQAEIQFLGEARVGLEWRPTAAFATRAGLDFSASSSKNFFVGGFVTFDYLIPLTGHL